MRNCFRSIFLASAFLAIVSCSQKDKVALLSCGSDAETDSLAALVGRCGYECSVIDIGNAFNGYDLIWYHRSNTSAPVYEGLFGDSMPGRLGSRIVATQWEYIYYQPKDKVKWETPVGKN